MKNISNIIQNIAVAIGLLVVGFIGIYTFYLNDSSALHSSGLATVSEAEARANEFRSTLNGLASVQLDTALLSDPLFTSLQDFSPDLETRSFGRPNPFR